MNKIIPLKSVSSHIVHVNPSFTLILVMTRVVLVILYYFDDSLLCFCHLVNGKWSGWEKWTSCSLTCGNGTQTRARTCDKPKPSGGGKNCTGSTSQKLTCVKKACPGNINVFIGEELHLFGLLIYTVHCNHSLQPSKYMFFIYRPVNKRINVKV